MPLNYAESIRHKLRALTGKNPGHEIGTGFLTLAEDIDKYLLGTVTRGTNVIATSGELVKATAEITVKTPTASLDVVFGVLANGHAVAVEATSGVIYGYSTAGVAEALVIGHQYMVLQSDGTNWYLIGGLPAESVTGRAIVGGKALVATETSYSTKAYSKVEAEAGVEPSSLSLAFVVLSNTSGLSTSIFVGGETLGSLPTGQMTGFLVQPGQKWSSSVAVKATTLLISAS